MNAVSSTHPTKRERMRQKNLNHYTFLGNCPPTRRLSQHFSLTAHLGQNVGLGEG